MTCYVKCSMNNSFQSPVKWDLYESPVLDEKAETQRSHGIHPRLYLRHPVKGFKHKSVLFKIYCSLQLFQMCLKTNSTAENR